MPHAKVICHQPKAIVAKCAHCGRKVRRYKSHNPKTREYFCSRQCHGLHRRQGSTLKCEHCGKAHYVQRRGVAEYRHHYCSQACCQAARSVIVPCDQCGKPVSRAGKNHDKAFCNLACYSAWRRAGLFQAWKASQMPTARVKQIR